MRPWWRRERRVVEAQHAAQEDLVGHGDQDGQPEGPDVMEAGKQLQGLLAGLAQVDPGCRTMCSRSMPAASAAPPAR
jgi:hypothetical protein